MSTYSHHNRKIGPYLVLILILPGIQLLAGCGETGRDTDPPMQEITVGITPFLGEAATYIAKEEGFFEEEGLNVSLEINTAGSESIRELLDGTVDIAHVAETPIVYALMDYSYYKKAWPDSFQIFADMMYASTIQKIIARKDHGISRPQDISGKKVATYRDTQLDYYLDSFLLEYQIPRESINIVDIEPFKQIEAIENGRVDVVVNWEPHITRIYNALGDNALTLETKLTYSTLWLATTLNGFAREHSDVLVAYLKALKKAQQYIEQHPESVQQRVAEYTDTRPDIIRALWDELDYELSLSERMLTLLEDQARWLNRNGKSDTVNFDMEHLINYQPMQEVYPDGITVIK